jgi:branched-chain amino acid transport system permease protein
MSSALSAKKIFSILVLLFLLVFPATQWTSPYWVHVFIMSVFNIGMAASVRLIFLAGEISIGHAAFMAIGAYTSALLVKNLGCSFWLGLPAGAITAALIALFIGHITLRAKGIYFIITTLAFGEVILLIISNWGLLGAVNGISKIPRPAPLFGLTFTGHVSNYYLVFLLTLLTLGICYRFERSHYGLILRSIAQAPQITESIGINIMSHKVLAFVLACFLAGMYGSFYAHYTTVIHPDMFSLYQAVMFLIYFQIGGVGSIWGAIVGGGFLTLVAEFLRKTHHLEILCFGALLMVIVLFLPEGLISLPFKVNSVFSWNKRKPSAEKEIKSGLA